jgi:Cu/Ag efflux protein CusF
MKRHLCLLVLAVGCFAQTAPPAAGQAGDITRAVGEVTAVNAATHEISIKADSGGVVTVKLMEGTLYLRVPLGEKDLKKATPITLADVGVGDRVLARGRTSEDHAALQATRVFVMTRTDVARKHAADREEWQKRGTAGAVTATNPATREITISVGARETARVVTVEAPASVAFRRYSPDSVRFADAQPSGFEALTVGDRLRVLGDRSADGSRIKAEEIVFGAFRNIAGVVKTVDAATGEIRLTDLETKKPVLIHIKTESMMRRLPEGVAMMIARRRQMAANGGAPPAAPGQPAQGGPPAQWQGGGQGGPGGGGPRGPRGGMDFQQALERMPALTLAELKPGDALIVSSTKGADISEATAIVVVAGVEPLLTSASGGPAMGGMGGALNFEIGPQ